MAGRREQVDKDVIMINQQHVYTRLAPPPGASSLRCDRPLIYDMIASAVCLRGAHKSNLITVKHKGTPRRPPSIHCKKIENV